MFNPEKANSTSNGFEAIKIYKPNSIDRFKLYKIESKEMPAKPGIDKATTCKFTFTSVNNSKQSINLELYFSQIFSKFNPEDYDGNISRLYSFLKLLTSDENVKKIMDYILVRMQEKKTLELEKLFSSEVLKGIFQVEVNLKIKLKEKKKEGKYYHQFFISKKGYVYPNYELLIPSATEIAEWSKLPSLIEKSELGSYLGKNCLYDFNKDPITFEKLLSKEKEFVDDARSKEASESNNPQTSNSGTFDNALDDLPF